MKIKWNKIRDNNVYGYDFKFKGHYGRLVRKGINLWEISLCNVYVAWGNNDIGLCKDNLKFQEGKSMMKKWLLGKILMNL